MGPAASSRDYEAFLTMDWVRDDNETAGEGVAYCTTPGCPNPVELYLGLTVVIERCVPARHIQHCQAVYARAWFGEP